MHLFLLCLWFLCIFMSQISESIIFLIFKLILFFNIRLYCLITIMFIFFYRRVLISTLSCGGCHVLLLIWTEKSILFSKTSLSITGRVELAILMDGLFSFSLNLSFSLSLFNISLLHRLPQKNEKCLLWAHGIHFHSSLLCLQINSLKN